MTKANLYGKIVAAIGLFVLSSPAAIAEDDPNAATTAETARLTAEAARINAEAVLNTAKAAKDKAAVEALGLPKIENKTTLENDGGAIETSMLAGVAVSKAAAEIAGKIDKAKNCTTQSKILVLAGNNSIDLNAGRLARARMDYLKVGFENALEATKPKRGSRGPASVISPALITAAISAASSLFASDIKVTGVGLDEINDAMLANAVAGYLTDCAILPSASPRIADIENSEIAKTLAELASLRQIAGLRMKSIAKTNKDGAALLKAVIDEFDVFNKIIGTPDDDGQTPFVTAILAEQLAVGNPLLLRIAVNKAGGTITNTKNLVTTLFAQDPVRVSGGLVASYALVDASDGRVKAAGSISCQTAQAKLRDIQSGNWWSKKQSGKRMVDDQKQTAICQ